MEKKQLKADELESVNGGTLATLLGNDKALQMYDSVMKEDLSETLQVLLEKFVRGDSLQLYRNEIGLHSKGRQRKNKRCFLIISFSADEQRCSCHA